MSRIGKKTIELPKGVEIKQDGSSVTVKGPKGTLSTPLVAGIGLKVENNVLQFTRPDEEKKTRAFHGLMRALVANNVRGVSEGFKRELDIVGVGYRAEVKGKQVHFALGYSHPVVFDIPTGIDIAVDKQTHVVVTGVDRKCGSDRRVDAARQRGEDRHRRPLRGEGLIGVRAGPGR